MKFKKFFFRGLVIILPLWITLYIVWLLFNLIGGFTRPFLKPIVFAFFQEKEYVKFILDLISFFLTIFVIYIGGVLTTNIFSKKILLNIENILLHIPILKGIYSGAKKLVEYLSGTKDFYKSYKKVVLIEFPRKGIFSIGFITNEIILNENKLCVFIPTTPNPTTGYFLIVSNEDIIPLDITIEDAIKMIVSGGIILPKKFTKKYE